MKSWKMKLWRQDKSEAIGKLIMLFGILVINILNMMFWHNSKISLTCLVINEVILFELLVIWISRLHNHLVVERWKKELKRLKELIERK